MKEREGQTEKQRKREREGEGERVIERNRIDTEKQKKEVRIKKD